MAKIFAYNLADEVETARQEIVDASVNTNTPNSQDNVFGFITYYKGSPVYVKYNKSKSILVCYEYKNQSVKFLKTMHMDEYKYNSILVKLHEQSNIFDIDNTTKLEAHHYPVYTHAQAKHYVDNCEYDMLYGELSESEYFDALDSIKEYGVTKCPVCGRLMLDKLGQRCTRCTYSIDLTQRINVSVLNRHTIHEYKKSYTKMTFFRKTKMR